MIAMRLSETARLLNTSYQGADVEFHGVSTDTRKLQANNLFIALHGPHFDAHDFIAQAQAQGAAAALLSKPVAASLPSLCVDDTRLALGQLASAWRQRFTLPVVAVTGSNGKTTVKEMIAAIFNQSGPVLVTQGNLNNDIGLPLTLLGLQAEHRFAVIEMGANHAGEIAYLTKITRPNVAVITNVGPAHLEGFGSLEGVAHAKGEIFQGLAEHGTAIINSDDRFATTWDKAIGNRHCLHFGLETQADVSARWTPNATGSALHLHTPQGKIDVALHLIGKHNVMNALAASAAALAAGATLTQIKSGLEAMQPVTGRLQSKAGLHGTRIIDDTYNANPASVQAALQVLANYPSPRWLVLGDMGELGPDSAVLHEQVGTQARAAQVERVFAVGKLSQGAVDTFGGGAQHFGSQDQLITALQTALGEIDTASPTILVKGSRAAHMEHIVAALAPTTTAVGGH
ncbi:MAG TPA: UDP-N-acetylmuramoyl-tripeptide--D-alanyl-D-alanine ligase [Gammaproteobacteria bacterium]|nr:UDP-N-acetylmuramoyl-tripeptide--D-alanyl-D-alanine ligase [Gammaproteobacteria bacterium]